jgi:signal transduction histidine kinase
VLTNLFKSNKNQLHLVQKLLEIYKYEVGALAFEIAKVDVKAVILSCVESALSGLANAPAIEISFPEELPPVAGDTDALSRLFRNLVDNAIRFGRAKESIEIVAETVSQQVVVTIHNQGPAIPAEVRSNLFQKFWQGVPGKSYVAHTGLGLYLCHRIVTLHHGKISCRSTEEGTTFTVKLPTA